MKSMTSNIMVDSSGLPTKKPGFAAESAFYINDIGSIYA